MKWDEYEIWGPPYFKTIRIQIKQLGITKKVFVRTKLNGGL